MEEILKNCCLSALQLDVTFAHNTWCPGRVCQKTAEKSCNSNIFKLGPQIVVATQAQNLLVHVSDKVTAALNSSNNFISLFPWSSLVSNAKENIRLPFFLQFHSRKSKSQTKRCNN